MKPEEFREEAIKCADAILKAAGSGLKNYSLHKIREDIISQAIQSLHEAYESGFRYGLAVTSERCKRKIESEEM